MEINVALDGRVVSMTAEGSYDPAVVRALAEGCVRAGDDDPATWPVDPLH